MRDGHEPVDERLFRGVGVGGREATDVPVRLHHVHAARVGQLGLDGEPRHLHQRRLPVERLRERETRLVHERQPVAVARRLGHVVEDETRAGYLTFVVDDRCAGPADVVLRAVTRDKYRARDQADHLVLTNRALDQVIVRRAVQVLSYAQELLCRAPKRLLLGPGREPLRLGVHEADAAFRIGRRMASAKLRRTAPSRNSRSRSRCGAISLRTLEASSVPGPVRDHGSRSSRSSRFRAPWRMCRLRAHSTVDIEGRMDRASRNAVLLVLAIGWATLSLLPAIAATILLPTAETWRGRIFAVAGLSFSRFRRSSSARSFKKS